MSKNRYINTRFWDDNYTIKLDPIEKLLFLYLLTNPLTSICGIYEISLRRIAFDTGIDSDMISTVLSRFSKDKKIFYINGWVVVKNFLKHQVLNPSVIAGIKREFKEVPNEIKDTLGTEWNKLSELGLLKLKLKLKLKPNLTNIDTLYSAYKEKINKGSLLTDKAKDKIKIRLKVFSVEQLLKAIDNFSQDSWWMEHNSSRGVAWFFHTDERIDQLINLKPRKKLNPRIS